MMATPVPFVPLTKEDVAEALGITPRTIENWVDQGHMPAPACIGNRLYWHPELFYGWLDQRLRVLSAPKVQQDDLVEVVPKKASRRGGTELERLRYKSNRRIASIEGD
jgi:excisionase family DNA binding protein